MAKALKKGDKAGRSTPREMARGTVKKKLTSATNIKGNKTAARKAEPENLVKSEKTRKTATPKAGGLKKAKADPKGSVKAKASAKPKKEGSANSSSAARKKSTPAAPKRLSKPAKSPSKRLALTKGTPSRTTAKKVTPKAKKRVSVTPNKTATRKVAAGKAPKVNTDQVIKEFRAVVNLTPGQLERWLSMPDSKKLGFKDEVKAGTVGHESGRRILKILTKRRDKYTEDDLRHMQTVVGFVNRHRAQKPPGDIVASNWRYSLMNWGHDPTKFKTARGKA